MANDGKIDEIVDPVAYAQIEKLTSLLVNAEGKLVSFTTTAKNFNDELSKSKSFKEFEVNATNTAKALQDVSKASEETKKKGKEIEDVFTKIGGSADEATKKQTALRFEFTQLANQQKGLKKEFDAGKISQEQYIQGSSVLATKQNELKKSIAQVVSEAKNEAKQNQLVATSNDAKAAKLLELKKVYNSLSEAERDNKKVGGELLTQIQALDKELKNQGKGLGEGSRFVGLYTDALDQAPGPIGNFIKGTKELFTLLFTNPIGLIVTALYGLYQALQQNDEAATFLKGVMTGLSTILSNVANAIVKFVVPAIKYVVGFIGDLVEGSKGLFSVVDKILSVIPGYTLIANAITSVAKNTAEAIKASILYEKELDNLEFAQNKFAVTISKANLLIQKQKTIVADSTKSLKDRLKALDEQSRLEAVVASTKTKLIDIEIAATERLLKSQDEAGTLAEATQFKLFELQVKRNEALLAQEELETNITKRRSALIKQVQAENQKRLQDEKKDAFELSKTRLEIEKEDAKRLANDQTNAYELRLASQEVYFNRSKQLLEEQYAFETLGLEKGSDKQLALKAKLDNDLQNLSRQNRQEQLAIIQDTLSQEEQLVLKAQQDRNLKLQAQRDSELAKIKGSSEEAEKVRKDINEKYLKIILKNEIDALEAVISANKKKADELGVFYEDQAKNEADLAALKLKYSQIDQKESAKKTDALKTALQETSKLTSEVFSTIGSLSSAYYTKQLNDINETQNFNNKKYDSERKNIENSTASEEEKRIKLAILDKQKAAQDEKLAERKKQADLAKAKRDRAIQIGQIIANTAIAVLSQLSIPGAGFGLAAAAAAVGALQLAAVLATPLPAYEEGGVHPADGPALFSEKGRELRIDPDGSVSLTPSKPTIGFVKKGTEFISNDNLQKMLASGSLSSHISNASNVDFDVKELIRSGERNTDKLGRKISKHSPFSYTGRTTTYKTKA